MSAPVSRAPVDGPVDPRAGHLPGRPAVIALDGPGGSGKSTVARGTARRLGWRHLDTGSTYRAATYLVQQEGLDPHDEAAVDALLARRPLQPDTGAASGTVVVEGRRLDAELRTDAVAADVSAVSALPAVRRRLVAVQQAAIAAATADGGIVVEGRDIGTAVAPDAPVKVFLVARPEVRAARRAGEQGEDPAAVQARLARRDAADESRALSPTAAAPDAVVLDTSDLTADEVVDRVVGLWHAAPATTRDDADTATTAPDGTDDVPVPPIPAGVVTAPANPHRVVAGRVLPPFTPFLVRLLRPPAKVLARLLWRVRVTGLEHIPADGPVLVVGNHAGALDGPLVVAFVRRMVRILAKVELYDGRLGDFLHRVGQIPVDRGRPDRQALHAALAVLRDGGVLGIFPEGTRGAGEVRDVRGGAAYLFLHAPCTIVPVVCTGTETALPKGGRPRLRVPVHVDFGPPLQVRVDGDPRARSTVAAATEQIRAGVAAHLARVRGEEAAA